jgi:GGDEF domain-containing protein
MSDIHYLMGKALEDRGHSYEICWTKPGYGQEYVLSVEANSRGGDAHWKMFAGLSRESKPLWTYISCDVLLVFNLVKSTAGDDGKSSTDPSQGSNSNIATLVRRDVTSQQVPVGSAPGSGKKSQALAGDLSLVQIPTLLQSILMAKMTGVLEVEDPDGKGRSQVFFKDGQAVHCVASDSFGEEGILELLSWKEGSFHFDATVTNEVHTIKHNLDSLLLQGMTLIDTSAFLSNLGVTLESYLQRVHTDLSDDELAAHCKKGAPVNMQKQTQLYRAIDPDKTLAQTLEKFKWPRSQWVPVLSNLFKTEVVALAPPRVQDASQLVVFQPKRIDKNLIQNVMMALRNPETGLFSYASFLYFVEQEYFRAYRSSNPMSVVVFQMRVQGSGVDAPREPLPVSALSAAVRKISTVKRYVDLLAHYETYDFAALLPNTKCAGATVFATRVLKALMNEPLVPGIITPDNFKAGFGIASIPEDFLELSQVLSAAEIAKTFAATGPEPIVLFSDVKHKYSFPNSPPPPTPPTQPI